MNLSAQRQGYGSYIRRGASEKIICPMEARVSTIRLLRLDSTYLPHDTRQVSVGLVATDNGFNV